MKLDYMLVYENSSDRFGIEPFRIKVTVTVVLKNFPHSPQYKLSGVTTQLWHKLGSLY